MSLIDIFPRYWLSHDDDTLEGEARDWWEADVNHDDGGRWHHARSVVWRRVTTRDAVVYVVDVVVVVVVVVDVVVDVVVVDVVVAASSDDNNGGLRPDFRIPISHRKVVSGAGKKQKFFSPGEKIAWLEIKTVPRWKLFD